MKTNHFLSLAAVFTIAITFFACSGDSPSEPPPGGESSSDSSGDNVRLCGGVEYDATTYRCEGGELIGKCRGVDFYPAYQACNDGVIEDKNPKSSSSSSLLVLSSSSSVQSSSGGISSSSSRVCKSSDLGKGYDVIGSPYINWTEVNSIAVLDQDKMCQDDILELDKPGGAQQYTSFSGNSIKDFYSKRNESMKISANLGVDINILWVFSANFDVKFAQKTSSGSQQNSSYKYYYAQIRSYLYTGEDQIKSGSASAQNLSKYLRSDFISDLKSTKSAGQILDLYGSHIFIHYYKGGSLEANYTYLGSESNLRFTSASQMELAAKGSFAKIDAGIGINSGSSNQLEISELEQHMSFNYETYGGTPLKATSMTQLGSEYGAWVSSIRNNARITGIKDFAQSFISIWDLAQHVEGVSSARINDLRNEFKRRAEVQGGKFPMEEDCTPADNNSTHYCANGFLTEYGSVNDAAGKAYKTVAIGTQTWMAENLNYNATGSLCYENDPANCTKYGKLYDWATAMALPGSCNESSCLSQISAKHKGICPAGYHIPSIADWDKLINYVGGEETAGRYLKATVGWNSCGSSNSYQYKCEDKYGFAALPGCYDDNSGYVSALCVYSGLGNWWSASEGESTYHSGLFGNDYWSYPSYVWSMTGSEENSYSGSSDKRGYFISVRCLKD
jgi:uncharacterized protein (TIGR02145 family)